MKEFQCKNTKKAMKVGASSLPMGLKQKRMDDAMKVGTWLIEQVGLPEYVETFVKQGFDSVEIIAQLLTEKDLSKMEIPKAHRKRIMIAAKQLKVELWLSNEVMLPQYVSLFVENGFDSLEKVSQDLSKKEINEWNVPKEDQKHIRKALKKLRQRFAEESLQKNDEEKEQNGDMGQTKQRRLSSFAEDEVEKICASSLEDQSNITCNDIVALASSVVNDEREAAKKASKSLSLPKEYPDECMERAMEMYEALWKESIRIYQQWTDKVNVLENKYGSLRKQMGLPKRRRTTINLLSPRTLQKVKLNDRFITATSQTVSQTIRGYPIEEQLNMTISAVEMMVKCNDGSESKQTVEFDMMMTFEQLWKQAQNDAEEKKSKWYDLHEEYNELVNDNSDAPSKKKNKESFMDAKRLSKLQRENVENIRDKYDIDSIDILQEEEVESDIDQSAESFNKAMEKAFAVGRWLQNEIALPQYIDAFIVNGYISMDIIIETMNLKDLKKIGVPYDDRQDIMELIKKLRMQRNGNVDKNEEIYRELSQEFEEIIKDERRKDKLKNKYLK